MTDFIYREPAKVVMDILQFQLGLKSSQVIFSNEKWDIPTKGPLVVVSYMGPSKTICNVDEMLPDGFGGQMEVQTLTMEDMIEIQVLGYNESQIRALRPLVAMAFNSIYAQQQCEQWNMFIPKHIGDLHDISYVEGTSMITRYGTTIRVTSLANNVPPAPSYYDIFTIPPPVTVNA